MGRVPTTGKYCNQKYKFGRDFVWWTDLEMEGMNTKGPDLSPVAPPGAGDGNEPDKHADWGWWPVLLIEVPPNTIDSAGILIIICFYQVLGEVMYAWRLEFVL